MVNQKIGPFGFGPTVASLTRVNKPVAPASTVVMITTTQERGHGAINAAGIGQRQCPAGYPRRRATGQEFGRRRGPKPCRSQGLEPRQWRGPGGARASLAHGLEAVAATWFGEIWSRAHRLGEGRAAVADAGPDLIHDLRIYVRRLCALSDLLPRPPGARPMRRALRKEVAWAMQPLSRARDWDVFTMEVLPQLCDADPDIDPQASAAGPRRSEIAHDEMYANLQTERFQAMLRLLRERSAEIPAAMAERAPRSLYRALGRRLEGWDALRARLDNAADQGPRRQHAARIRVKRLRYASEALLLLSPSRKLERYVKALADVQGALGSAQDFRAAALGRDVCQPVDRQAGGSTRRQSGPAIAAQGRRWPALSQPAPAAAAVFLGAGQPRTVARRLGSAGAEAPRATA